MAVLPTKSPLEVLQPIWWVGVLSLAAALVVTPIMRFIAYRTRIVDKPDDLLKPHGRPVAYLGGVAMCIGLVAGLLGFLVAMPDARTHWRSLREALCSGRLTDLMKNPVWKLLGMLLSSVAIMLVGLIDDIRKITPRQKVCGQVLAAAILYVGGVGDGMASMLFSLVGLYPPIYVLLPVRAAMLLVIVIATCNATNLLDGLDGLCGGVTGIIALGFLALATWLGVWGHFPGSDELRVALCLAMAGAVLGFLPYNIPPASIFMGDAGSMLLGFFVATMMGMFCQEGTVRWFVAAWAVFALPTLDTALAVVRRLLSGKPIFTGDRSHLYDQLVDRGMTVKQVVGLFYLLAALAAGIGVTVAILLRGREAIVLYLVLLVVIWGVFYKKGMIKPEPRKPAGHDDGPPPERAE
jgi:UDP-GlcNAc:undecaprenyl-phosphate GlcNAc-1-phosphate transferase